LPAHRHSGSRHGTNSLIELPWKGDSLGPHGRHYHHRSAQLIQQQKKQVGVHVHDHPFPYQVQIAVETRGPRGQRQGQGQEVKASRRQDQKEGQDQKGQEQRKTYVEARSRRRTCKFDYYSNFLRHSREEGHDGSSMPPPLPGKANSFATYVATNTTNPFLK
jgi:hypothetical protein